MRGLALHPNGKYAMIDAPEPRIGENRFAPHDVLIEVELCGICGSDVHLWGSGHEGLFGTKRPVVGGHEIVGRVAAVGEKVSAVQVGDRVVCEVANFYCGRCVNCKQGRFNICCNVPPIEGRAHYMVGGGFARYCVWPEAHVHRLPDNVSDRAAVLMEPTAGAAHGLYERAHVSPGETVVILGPGARGIILAQLARAAGAKTVIVTGVTRDVGVRLPMAKRLADAICVNVDEQDLAEVVRDVTGGIGADVVVENAGVGAAVNQAIQIARPGGRVVVSGGGIRGGVTAEIDTHPLIVKELTIYGEISQTWTSWRTAINLVEMGKVQLEPLVTTILPLESWEEGFELAARSPDVIRVALTPKAG